MMGACFCPWNATRDKSACNHSSTLPNPSPTPSSELNASMPYSETTTGLVVISWWKGAAHSANGADVGQWLETCSAQPIRVVVVRWSTCETSTGGRQRTGPTQGLDKRPPECLKVTACVQVEGIVVKLGSVLFLVPHPTLTVCPSGAGRHPAHGPQAHYRLALTGTLNLSVPVFLESAPHYLNGV